MKLAVFISCISLLCCGCTSMDRPHENRFGPIYFDHNSSEIDPSYFPRLDSIGAYVSSHPGATYEASATSHPEEDGYADQFIHRERVDAVYRYLNQKFGIPIPDSWGVKVDGPALERDSEAFQKPEEKKFRRVEVDITVAKTTD